MLLLSLAMHVRPITVGNLPYGLQMHSMGERNTWKSRNKCLSAAARADRTDLEQSLEAFLPDRRAEAVKHAGVHDSFSSAGMQRLSPLPA